MVMGEGTGVWGEGDYIMGPGVEETEFINIAKVLSEY